MMTNIHKIFDKHSPREARQAIEDVIIVVDLKTNEIVGKVLDINLTGISLLMDDKVKLNSQMNIKLILENNSNKQFIELEVINRWCHVSLNSDTYKSGFSITKLNAKAKLRLKGILKSAKN